MKDKLINQYHQQKHLYQYCNEQVQKLIEQLVKSKGIKVHNVSSRLKSEISLERKIDLKHKYLDLNEITDISAIRVITLLEKDVDSLSLLIAEEFKVDYANSKIEKIGDDPSLFGYKSLHYICQIGSKRAELAEYANIADIKFEIQIRSILQHAWGEIEHDLGYKSEIVIPKHLRRQFSRVAGLLELADEEFNSLRESIEIYKKKIEAGDISDSLEIDRINIEYLMNNNSDYIEINEFIRKKFRAIGVAKPQRPSETIESEIKWFKTFGIVNYGQLKSFLSLNKQLVITFADNWIKEGKNRAEIIYTTLGLLYINYILLMKSEYDVVEYFRIRRLGRFEEGYKRSANLFNEVKKKIQSSE